MAKFDYYWRDYYGDIPDDAFPAGYDRNLEPTYIGQLFVLNHGLLTTRIYKGQKCVTASKEGIHTSSEAIKILCSTQAEKFRWIPSTACELHVETIGKHLVVGGYENGKILNIGRGSYQEEVIVGKVCSYNIGNALMYFPYKNEEVTMDSYEVLIYDNNNIDDIDVR
ncbi:uncharacterized protein LOC103314048 [Tribolium castaneum]|uniref:Uncharacterized protein n=1 Tax=Tribolium castaneum TaxID=7070 RepID=D6WX06_TRICA|nr:PREDICTED: uncharacterized protein LOC103314048 [Tribolium castaneum]EFA08774.2 hypothetical protein TcasGA2_TC006464 [Tribolium castaneum]|eukprot:XP_008197062.1 PREDICTED: uncharacterized protein LOC103314048 [Tribolium castaneum]